MNHKPRNKIRQRRRLADMDMSKVPLKKLNAITIADFTDLSDEQQQITASRLVEDIMAKRMEQ